ncbi:hypothetical protein CHUAL_001429 [Chamberlinius hualienensis]
MIPLRNIRSIGGSVRSFLCIRYATSNVYRMVINLNRRYFMLNCHKSYVNEASTFKTCNHLQLRFCSNNRQDLTSDLDIDKYHRISEETLVSLCEHFEELVSDYCEDPDADVTFGNGVLTVNLGSQNGTYVINKQTPNKQIWLSSPFSGPKRYDCVNNQWIYRRDGITLQKLLSDEMSKALNITVDFSKSAFSQTS